jgi:hypothetical protein
MGYRKSVHIGVVTKFDVALQDYPLMFKWGCEQSFERKRTPENEIKNSLAIKNALGRLTLKSKSKFLSIHS